MFLVHIHFTNRPILTEVDHQIFTDGDHFLSETRPLGSASNSRFSIDSSELESNDETWFNRFSLVETFSRQLGENDLAEFEKVYTFAAATSYLLRSNKSSSCRTICWECNKKFMAVWWGNGERHSILIRHNRDVFRYRHDEQILRRVATEDEILDRRLDPIRDQLPWQFIQYTTYGLDPQQVEALAVSADISQQGWRKIE